MIASLMYLVNFQLRKIDRKTELFRDLERSQEEDRDPVAQRNAEDMYDKILDIMMTSIKDNYGQDEINFALDMVNLDLELLKDQSDFEMLIKEKQELERRLKEGLKQRAEEQLRA